MKDFFRIMEKDIQKENFTKKEIIVYGVIVPIAFLLIIGLV